MHLAINDNGCVSETLLVLECKKDFKDFSIAAISPPKVTAP